MPESRPRRPQRSPQQIASTRRHHILGLGLLVLLVYASALGGGFVWTDREDLLQGAHRITSLADLSAALSQTREAYRARVIGGDAQSTAGGWQPLTILSNTVSWALWGDCAFCFHLENILLHGLLVIGLYALGRHVLTHRRHGNTIAVWAAAIYAVHPAAVTSVAWIGGRPYLLATVLGVWSLVIFTRLQATSKSRPGHVNRWLGGLTIASLAAMLAHETAYLLPLLALLIAAIESQERGRDPLGGISPLRLKGLALLFGTLLIVIAYRSLVLGGLHFSGDYPSQSWFNNIGTALRHLWFLIDQALLPGEPIISDAWPITRQWGTAEIAALLGLIPLLGATLLGLKIGHPSAFGVAWFLLWLIPGIGIFPSEHYHNSQTLYPAVWGLAFALAYGLFLLWRPVGRQLVAGSEAVLYVPIILLLAVITGFSNVRWWNHSALFQSEIASDPHYMEGRLELAKAALEQNDPGGALNHALAAIEASRDDSFTGYWSPREGFYLLGRAQWEMASYHDAIGSFRTVVEAYPEDAEAHYWLGRAQLSVREFGAAESSLQRALEIQPALTEAKADLGAALAGQQRFVEAYPLLAAAIDGGIGNPARHQALAMTLIDAGQLEQAATQLEAALALDEQAVERARLAWVRWRLGRTEQATRDLNMALQMEEESDPYVSWVQTQLRQPPPAQ